MGDAGGGGGGAAGAMGGRGARGARGGKMKTRGQRGGAGLVGSKSYRVQVRLKISGLVMFLIWFARGCRSLDSVIIKYRM